MNCYIPEITPLALFLATSILIALSFYLQERATMLDTLVTGSFSSSGGEEDVYLPHPSADPPAARDGAVADRLRDGR